MRLPAALLALCLFATPALAQQADAQRLALARRVAVAGGVTDHISAVVSSLGPQIIGASLREDAPDFPEELIPVLVQSLAEELKAKPEFTVDAVARIYASKFTAQQLQAAATFYESPDGRAFVVGSLALQDQFEAAGVELVSLAMPGTMKRFEAKVAARSSTARSAPAKPAPAWTKQRP